MPRGKGMDYAKRESERRGREAADERFLTEAMRWTPSRKRVRAADAFLAAKEPLPTADSRRSAPENKESEHE
jgi:hypothetical protein